MNVPRLRFKEFSDEWTQRTIQELVNSRIILKPIDGNHGEIHPKSSDYVDTGIPFIMANDIRNNVVDIEAAKRIPKNQADKLQKGFSLEGDVLLTHKASVGFVAIVPALATDYIMLTPQVTYYRIINKQTLNNNFLANYFISPIFQKHLMLLSGGGTRAYVGITDQRNLKVCIPAIEEQTKIANFLTAIDEKITQLTQKHDLLRQYKKGVMQQIFSQKLRFRDDDGREFPEWEVKLLSDINIYVSDGNYGEQYPKSGELKQHGVPFIRANNISGLSLTWADMRFIDHSLHETLTSGHLETNDILVTTRGDIGMVAYVDSEFHGANINAQICLLRVIDENKLNAKYLLQLLSSAYCQKQFKELQTGSALKQLPKKNLSQIEIFYPIIQEQTKIANFLTAIDDKITHSQAQLKAVKHYKKGLLQQMFV